MGQLLGRKIYKAGPGCFIFFCPGCGENHRFTTAEGGYIMEWNFNGDGDRPTVSPSIKIQFGYGAARICHLFVDDGRLQYLPDSTHYLAGQTIDMPDWELREDEPS